MDRFSMKLNTIEKSFLEAVAKEEGYDSGRDFINAKVKEFPTMINPTMLACKGKSKKYKNIYDIPDEVEQFYNTLSCYHSTPVSAIIFRYIIFPHIAKKFMEEMNP